MSEKSKYFVRCVKFLDRDQDDEVVEQADHLLFRRGYFDDIKSQLPIRDYRPRSKQALRTEEKNFEKNGFSSDLLGREVFRPAVMEIVHVVSEAGIILPVINLLSEPDFFPGENSPILVEIDLEPDDEILVNKSLWYWLSSDDDSENRVIIAVTDAKHPLIVRHDDSFETDEILNKDDRYWYSVSFSDIYHPCADEIEFHMQQDENWREYKNFFGDDK